MFQSKVFLTVIGFGLLLSGTSAFIAYFYEPLRTLFFIIAVTLFVVFLLMSQMAYGFYLYKQEQALKQKNMRKCPHCQKPIYRDDTTCPYCQSTV